MRTGIVLLGLLCAGIAAAGEERVAVGDSTATRIDLDSVAALVVSVTTCAALHSAAAEVLDREHLPQHAETARRRAQVDQVAAMYLLAQDHAAKGGPPRELDSYTSYVERLTAAATSEWRLCDEGRCRPSARGSDRTELIPLEDEILAKISAGERAIALSSSRAMPKGYPLIFIPRMKAAAAADCGSCGLQRLPPVAARTKRGSDFPCARFSPLFARLSFFACSPLRVACVFKLVLAIRSSLSTKMWSATGRAAESIRRTPWHVSCEGV
jgi:hypothetical protein